MVCFVRSLSSILLVLGLTILLALGQSTQSAFLQEICGRSEECQRAVVDSECKESVCACKQGYKQRSELFCQYSGDTLSSLWDVEELSCESPGECEVESDQAPCKRNYWRLKENTGASQVTINSQVLTVDCEGDVTLRFHSEIPRDGDAITVNYRCFIFVAGTKNFTVGHVKIQKPVGMDGEVETEECMFGRVPCTKYVQPCTDNCRQRTDITEYIFGLRIDCKPTERRPSGGGRQQSRTGCTLLAAAVIVGRLLKNSSL